MKKMTSAAIPTVAVSGYALPADRQRALHAGFSEHFAKPLELASVAKIMGSAQASASAHGS
jgi:CheY-like chemotaxis protein